MYALSLDAEGDRSRFLHWGVSVVGALRRGAVSSGCDFLRASGVCSARLRLSPSCGGAAPVPVVPTAD